MVTLRQFFRGKSNNAGSFSQKGLSTRQDWHDPRPGSFVRSVVLGYKILFSCDGIGCAFVA